MTDAPARRSIGRRIVRVISWLFLILIMIMAGMAFWNRDLIQRVFLGGVKAYEHVPPALPGNIARPAILVFSKTNGFRHEEAIPAGNALFAQMAAENNWGHYQTENGAVFSPDILRRFDVVVFNNVSGDVFTADQKAAFRAFVEGGGGYIGIHAAGDSSHQWGWFVTNLIGATFIGHPMDPQFQQATILVEDKSHPASTALPGKWQRTDEYYSFAASPRSKGFHILATLDETSYRPVGLFGQDLRMGKDHPLIWWKCVGRGRMLYSALGHTAESYSETEYRRLLQRSVAWAMQGAESSCPAKSAK